ncbi:hypothetical protein [Nonomuraea basaltis]|uniref:hypothetical protein n=1 Tax=Nonomuraea basaltis TaxID=2495887 RepID=UPI00110C59E7|nr:hypothetical protein [Nonomuraea basaltis]TMS00092.1 hypothetical protein EJK15_03200 [Nonomuraea basaltis]
MQDPTEPDRQEILSGPGDVRLAQRDSRPSGKPPKNQKKIIVIAASVLVGLLAAGGAGYMLAANPATPATQEGGDRPAPSQSAADDENFQDDDATMGDVTTDAPKDDQPGDGTVRDAAPDTDTGGDPAPDPGSTGADSSTGTDSSRGTAQTGNGTKPATSSPTKPPQSDEGDTPADGPAGEVIGQCASSGC